MSDNRPAPLIRPPRLPDGDEEHSASRLELFFDLAYVLVLAGLATSFSKHLDLTGALTFAGLVAVTWWSWVTLTLYANRFDTNDVLYRLAKLAATAAVLGMAASAQNATGSDAARFAACYLITRVLVVLLYARAFRHVPDARPTIAVYLAGAGVAAALWAISLPVDGPARYVLWGAGVLAEAIAPLIAGRVGDNVPLHLDHLPERFGLFVILVLGESIASIAHGVHDTHWSGPSVLAAICSFVTVAALWWIYFDLGGAAGKRELIEDGGDQESGVADAYVYGHLPVVLGLAFTAIGIEQLILHPERGLSTVAGWAVPIGVAIYLAGVAVVMVGTSGRWRSGWPWPVVVIPPVLVLGFVEAVPPLASVAGAAVLLVIAVLAGMIEQRRGHFRTTET